MNLSRRSFIGHLTTGGAAIYLVGCGAGGTPTVASILTEADNILMFIAPLGDGAAAIIEVADPAIAPEVLIVVSIYDKAVPAIEQLLTDWAAASAADQPGILSQIEAAVTALQADAQNIISKITGVPATVLAEINSITSSILGEISALLKWILQLKTAGGTSAALHHMAANAHKYVKMVGPNAKTQRDILVKQLQVPTNTNIDSARFALATKLAALQLK
jgi:hypothetical protein